MNKLPLLVAVAALGWPAAFVHAQSDAPEPPKPTAPFVAVPRPGTAWQIAVQMESAAPTAEEKNAGKTAARSPVNIQTQLDADLMHTVVTWSDGSRSEGYIVGDRCFQRAGANGKIFVQPVQDQNFELPLFTKGYPGMAWADLTTFQKVEMLGKLEVFHYSSRFTDRRGDSPDAADNQVKLDAWISTKENMPVRATIGKMTYTFGPVKDAPEKLLLPADFREFIDRADREQKALSWIRRGQRIGR